MPLVVPQRSNFGSFEEYKSVKFSILPTVDPSAITAFNNLNQLIEVMEGSFIQKYSQAFDRYRIDDQQRTYVLNWFKENKSYSEILKTLGINIEKIDDIRLPWVNELVAYEVEAVNDEFSGNLNVKFGMQHYLHKQLRTQGKLNINTIGVSCAAILITKPCETYPNGGLIMGVRTSPNCQNSLMFPAGSIDLSPNTTLGGFSDPHTQNTTDLTGLILKTEVCEETGLTISNIDTKTSPVIYRAYDIPESQYWYMPKFQLSVTFDEFLQISSQNPHPDKNEHSSWICLDLKNLSRKTLVQYSVLRIAEEVISRIYAIST